ncbi:kinase-like domain-containing protein [Fennellomyces sp. T-0311]|nr:kinase-like domain-containing protein [Fennellomyces sp. T-0311]
MSDLHQQQHHVSFVPTVKEDGYDPERFRNYYAPISDNATSTVSSSSDQHRARASSSSSESNPLPELTDALNTLYINYPTKRSLGDGRQNEIIDHSKSHDTEKVVEVSPDSGRYLRLNTLLGKGAYKVVYKAIDREEGYEVAWNSMQSMNNMNKLEHEIQILKSVRHPNIIAFHEAWYTENEFVFITELMTSGTLREYIRKLSLPNIKIVKRWSRQILKGLVYLHGHNPPIIHRDIKCDNIFINGAYGEVKIGDMGTAEMKMGKKYTVIGTPEFMAPEMYEEMGYSEKVDIYAFGMCLLEMATGEYPYGECTNPAQIYKKVMAGTKPACLAQVQNEEVLAVVENCLGPEDERMSAQEILEHTFFAVEPEVVLLATDDNNIHLSLQVVFKGIDKRSVKFDFNVVGAFFSETDTAAEVVHEMIEENILPRQYQQHITKEMARLLRDLDKEADNVHPSIWRRESENFSQELEDVRTELHQEEEHIHEKEVECEELERRARLAEERYQEISRIVQELKAEDAQQVSSPPPSFPVKEYSDDVDIETFIRDCAVATHRNADKAQEWIRKLQNQDIDTVGDLRDLHDEDWAGLGLTVFAARLIKNTLKGKQPNAGAPSISRSNTLPPNS